MTKGQGTTNETLYGCARCGNANGKWEFHQMTKLENPDGMGGYNLYCPACALLIETWRASA